MSIAIVKYRIPCTQKTITQKNIDRIRCGLAVTTLLTTAVVIEGTTSHKAPNWVYPIDGGAMVVSMIGFIATYCFKRLPLLVNNALSNLTIKLVDPKKIDELKVAQHVHELCEMDIQGKPKQCSFSRVQEIVQLLKEKQALEALNTVPCYYLTQCGPGSNSEPRYTPLQYWSSKGNLDIVRHLVEHGALDYCKETRDSYASNSALYVAALHGHSAVVDYLLQHEAQAAIPFRNNLLCYFIPKWVFEITQLKDRNSEMLSCLRKILIYLQVYKPNNLALQLKIPVSKTENCVGWVQHLMKDQDSFLKQLAALLEEFGGKAHDVISLDDLRKIGDVGPGLTLEETSRLK